MAVEKRKDKSLQKIKVNKTQTGLQFLKEHPLFDGRSRADCKEAATFFDVERLQKGDVLVRRGAVGDRIFIVADGVLELTGSSDTVSSRAESLHESFTSSFDEDSLSRNLDSQTAEIAEKNAVIGKMSFVHKAFYWKESVRVQSDSAVLLSMSRSDYVEVCNKKCFKNLKHSVDEAFERNILQSLQALPFMKGFPLRKIKSFAPAFKFVDVEEHKVICESDDVLPDLHILLTGEIVVANKSEEDMIIEYGRIRPLQEFGDPVLGEDEPLKGCLLTLTKCTFFVVSSLNIPRLEEEIPTFKGKLDRARYKGRTIRQTLEKLGLFKQLDLDYKRSLASILKSVSFSTGTVLKEEGVESDHRFYIITDGCVSVERKKKRICTLGRFSYFGELSLLTGAKSAADVIVVSESATSCLVLEERDFYNFIQAQPSAEAELMIKTKGSNCSLSHVLANKQAKDLFLNFFQDDSVHGNVNFLAAVADFEAFDKRKTKKTVVKAFKVDIHQLKSKKINFLRKEAQKIYDDFVVSDAINVKHSTLKEMHEKFKTGNYKFSTIFADAKYEIMNLLDFDKFPKFKKSPQFKQLLHDFGAYEVVSK